MTLSDAIHERGPLLSILDLVELMDEIARSLGVTQKTAWFMMHRVRLSFGDTDHDDMSGTVEADETYIGGKEANKPTSISRSVQTLDAGPLAKSASWRC